MTQQEWLERIKEAMKKDRQTFAQESLDEGCEDFHDEAMAEYRAVDDIKSINDALEAMADWAWDAESAVGLILDAAVTDGPVELKITMRGFST